MAEIATDKRLGHALRAIRSQDGLTQADVGLSAGISQPVISRLESGGAGGFTLNAIRAVARALDARVEVRILWRGAELERLLDERHARLAGEVVSALTGWGWRTQVEVSFSVYGERGSIDILAWHVASRSLLVIEVKTVLASIEELIRRLDVKDRLAPSIAQARFEWRPLNVSRLVVMPGDRSVYRAVERHATLLGSAFPTRGRQVRSWLRKPAGRLDGLWLVSVMRDTDVLRSRSPSRVRRSTGTRPG